MQTKIVEVKNIRRLQDMAHELAGRAQQVPGLGMLYGATGRGKTSAAAWLATDPALNLVYVRASTTWTTSSLLQTILRELGIEVAGPAARLLKLAEDALTSAGKSLIVVDEADYLVAGSDAQRMAEVLRDLHDRSGVAVLLISMSKLRLSDQAMGRVSHWLQFDAPDLEDTQQIARELCDVEVAPDLIARLHQASAGSVRNIVVGLTRIEGYAIRAGLETVDAATWGNRAFTFGSER